MFICPLERISFNCPLKHAFLLLVNYIFYKKATKNQLGGNTLRFLSDFLLIYVTLCKVSYAEKKGFLSCFCILFSFVPFLGLAIFKASHVLCVLFSDEVAGYYTLSKDFNYVLKCLEECCCPNTLLLGLVLD